MMSVLFNIESGVYSQHGMKCVKWVSNHNGKIQGFTKRGHIGLHLIASVEPVFKLEAFEA